MAGAMKKGDIWCSSRAGPSADRGYLSPTMLDRFLRIVGGFLWFA
jgi:hypothetical protein